MAGTVWKGYLSFGLVTFPVKLSVAARAKAGPFSHAPQEGHVACQGSLVLR